MLKAKYTRDDKSSRSEIINVEIVDDMVRLEEEKKCGGNYGDKRYS